MQPKSIQVSVAFDQWFEIMDLKVAIPQIAQEQFLDRLVELPTTPLEVFRLALLHSARYG